MHAARELTTQAFVRYELMPVAVTWTWATAAFEPLVGGQQQGLSIPTDRRHPERRVRPAQNAVHGGLEAILPIDFAVQTIEALRNTI
jgi:hypothetical protein